MSSTVNTFNDSTVSVSKSGTTTNGTKITTKAEAGGSMDKNAFLKILAAEMSNLDPSQDVDSTAYVTQMAQFSQIEQMSNLNDTMTKFSYEQLVGKGVTMTDTNSSGEAITGIVKAVTTDSSGTTYLGISVDGSSTTTSYKANDIASIIDSSESATSATISTALNSDFLAASALKGQDVVVSTTDATDTTKTVQVSGTIKSAYIDNGVVKINVTTKDGTTKEYPYSSVLKAGDLSSTTTTTA
jgi:flagellar basal-body rod modification protein FlgD